MRKLAMIKCPECGKMYSDTAASCPNCGYRKRRDFSQATMLITGTMSIVLAALCLNQSITVFRLTNIAGMQDYGGIAGILMAVFFIFASILAICLRKIDSTWPPLVCMGICLFASYVGAVFETAYKDVYFWATLVFLCSFIYLGIAIHIKKRQ